MAIPPDQLDFPRHREGTLLDPCASGCFSDWHLLGSRIARQTRAAYRYEALPGEEGRHSLIRMGARPIY